MKRPKNRSEVLAMFGRPGVNGVASPSWVAANIITVRDLPMVPSKWHFQVNRLVEPSLRAALTEAAASSKYVVERAASFVYRHQRHDVKRPLSYHSWGIAVDFDAAENKALTFAAGDEPKPWSTVWRRLWPHGVDEPFVVAMERQGWVWGGRWPQFVDPMHFQFVGR